MTSGQQETTYRCWICLDDSTSLDDMISPCACVGTNKWVHTECVKTYCLQHLAHHEPTSRELTVACPICKSKYNIAEHDDSAPLSPAARDGGNSVAQAASGSDGTWNELTQWSVDRQFLLRHTRFALLIAPLIGSSLIAWAWLIDYWRDLYANGAGEPLLEGDTPIEPLQPLQRPHEWLARTPLHDWMLSAILWLPSNAVEALEELLPAFFERQAGAVDADGAMPEASSVAGGGSGPYDSGERTRLLHPAGISKNWSLLYVSLQYAQWYKVLCWLLIMVVGGAEGVLPPALQEAFRVDELLLASEHRARIFLCGQCAPFVLTKARHFLVTWARGHWLIRTLFYSLFTSHTEVACNLACDSISGALLVHDWATSASNDLALRRHMRRLRQGDFTVVPYVAARTVPPADDGGSSVRQRQARQA